MPGETNVGAAALLDLVAFGEKGNIGADGHWSRHCFTGQSRASRRQEVATRLEAGGRSTGPDRPQVTVGEVVAAGESLLGFDLGRLRSREKAPEVVRAREVLAVVAVIRYRLKVKDVAKAMGMSADTASRWVSRAQRRMEIDDEFRAEVDRLDKALQGDDHRSPGI